MSNKKILFTIDLEQDLSKYIDNSYLGMEQATKVLENAFVESNVEALYFTTADIANRYPEFIRSAFQRNGVIGNHGMDHSVQYYCLKNYNWQLAEIRKSTEIISKIAGASPTAFRAPNFSVNGDTIKALIESDYSMDSSVIPGVTLSRYRMFKIFDFSLAPTKRYWPDENDVSLEGSQRKLLELPIATVEHTGGTPIGMGMLNHRGLEKAVELACTSALDPVQFIIHPWELVALRESYPKLRPWVADACKDSVDTLRMFIARISKVMEIVNPRELINEIQGR